MVSCMGEGVGLVHQMPFACDRTGIPATLEKVSFVFLHFYHYLDIFHWKLKLLVLTEIIDASRIL